MNRPLRVYIYGSCTTRDGVEFWDTYGLEMVGYSARQSVISAYSKPSADLFAPENIESPFQRRMVEGDIAGDLPGLLKDETTDYDLIIWDLTDERNGVFEVPGGGYVSRMPMYADGAYVGVQPLTPAPGFGKDGHFQLWCDATDRFLDDLYRLGKIDRLVVNATPWADRLDNGEPLLRPGRPGAEWFNTNAARYYAYLEFAGVRVARPDPSRVVAAAAHQWGVEPYHYAKDTYLASLDAITAELN